MPPGVHPERIPCAQRDIPERRGLHAAGASRASGDRPRRRRPLHQGADPGQPAGPHPGPPRRHRPGPGARRHRMGRPGLLGHPRRRASRARHGRLGRPRRGHHPPPPRPPRALRPGPRGVRRLDRDARRRHRRRTPHPRGRTRASGSTTCAPSSPAVGAPEEHIAPLREARASGRMRTLPGLRAALPDREIVPGELLAAGRAPAPRDLDAGAHAGPRLPPPGGGAPVPTPGQRPPVQRRPPAARHHPAHRPVRGPRRAARAADPLGDYLDSLERVGRLGVAEVLPAHQHAFTEPAARVRSCWPTTRTA